MTPVLHLIAGLPGSGKSRLSDAIAAALGCRARHDFLAAPEAGIRRVLEELAAGRSVVANDCDLFVGRSPEWIEATVTIEPLAPSGRMTGCDPIILRFKE